MQHTWDNETLPAGLRDRLDETGLLQSIGHDGGGREFRTNPISIKSLLKQVRGRKHFALYYQELSHSTEVLESGGTHIHISILDSDDENMEANAVALATAFYEQFQKIAGRQSGWAYKMQVRDISEVKRRLAERRQADRHYSMKGTILGPTVHKTLEFRGPMGSNNADEILAWVEFLDTVVTVANKKSVDGVKFSDLLKGTHLAGYVESLSGWRKLSKTDLNRTLNTAHLA